MEAGRGSLRRVIAASVVGTSLEWYDFFLYGTAAALVFGELFFPDAEPLVGTLLAFATYAVGFVARPVRRRHRRPLRRPRRPPQRARRDAARHGRGHVRDRPAAHLRHDRRRRADPARRAALRPGPRPRRRVGRRRADGLRARRPEAAAGCFASWPQVGVPAGNLLAAGVLAVLAAALSESAFNAWGWRIPFLLSAVLVFVGLWVRLRIEESPLFQKVEESATRGQGADRRGRPASTRASWRSPSARASAPTSPSTSSRSSSSPTRPSRLGLDEERRAERGADRLGVPALPHPGLRRPLGPRRPPAGVPGGRDRRGRLGLRLLPADRHRELVGDRPRRRRRPVLPRPHVRPAGRVHRRALRHPRALQRHVDGLPARRHRSAARWRRSSPRRCSPRPARRSPSRSTSPARWPSPSSRCTSRRRRPARTSTMRASPPRAGGSSATSRDVTGVR